MVSNPSRNQRNGAVRANPRSRDRASNAWRIWPGSTRKHSTRLATITAITANGMAITMLAKRPPIKMRAAKARRVVIAAAETGAAMRSAAKTAAVFGLKARERSTTVSRIRAPPTKTVDPKQLAPAMTSKGINAALMLVAIEPTRPRKAFSSPMFSVPGIAPSKPTVASRAKDSVKRNEPRRTRTLRRAPGGRR